MSTRVSTKQKLISQLEAIDSTLKDIVSCLAKRSNTFNLEPLVELLLERDSQLKTTLLEVESQQELHKKIDVLRADCAKSDKQIQSCQLQLKKSELLLSTALYYSRQKLQSMTKAVKNPVDMEELVRFSHRISAAHGVSAPDNWVQGDPRRPYPNREEIRRGYLGHLDDSGNFRSSIWDALSETAAAANLANSASGTSMSSTPTGSGAITSTVQPVSSAHMSGPALPGVTPSPDTLSTARSPNMLLPGVNMVSSPISVPQSHTGSWSSNHVANTSDASNTRTLAPAMFDSQSRSTPIQPPSLRFASDSLAPGTTSQMARSSTGPLRTGSGYRPAFSQSPRLVSSLNPNLNESGESKSSTTRTKRVKRKFDEAETISSDTCSDTSTDDN